MKDLSLVVRIPNWLGDIVMALPALSSLVNKYPDTTFWSRPGNSGLLPVFFGTRDIHVENRLPRMKFDSLLLMTDSFRTALQGYLSGISQRTGYSTDMRRLLLTHAIKPPDDRNHHHSLDYIGLSDAMGAHLKADIPAPRTEPAYESHVAFFAGAKYGSAKRWPGFAELALMLHKETGLPSVFYGTPEEECLLNEIASKIPMSSALTDLDIETLVSYLLSARIAIGNDSGGVHLSAAVGTPTVTIFGSTSPIWTAPLGRNTEVMASERSCSPCFKRKCPHGRPLCLDDISPEEVLSACVRLLKSGDN
ncbi:MAG: glycosyltransferase family 9 protein [Candidatus Aegiribacteria sp.]|nr:glycosyltransferase family 9 protein [Candidatus Aegiribacteria sp.]